MICYWKMTLTENLCFISLIKEKIQMVTYRAKSWQHWALCMAVTVGLSGFVVPSPAHLQELSEDQALHDPMTSDGSEAWETYYAAGEHVTSSESYEGTGEQPEIFGILESVEETWELLALEPQTAGVGIESIIGRDERRRVRDTRRFPYRAAALVTFTGGRCSGWMIGPDTVATAGHCVHDGGRGGSWKSNVRVFPGRNGGRSPFGSCRATRLYSVVGWVNNADEQYDYGAIKLNCNVGNRTGWFGFWWQSASLRGTPTIITGYPGDKPLEQWLSRDRVRVSRSRQIFYRNDTLGGMSGSPVFTNNHRNCPGYCSMGIHAYGLHGRPPHSNNNHGTRINRSVFNNLLAWRNASR